MLKKINICACGCNQECVKRFVHGHFWRNKKREKPAWNKGLTKETNLILLENSKKISKTQKSKNLFGKTYNDLLTPDGKKKQIERILRQKCDKCGKFRKSIGKGEWECQNCGLFSENHKQKIRRALKGRHVSVKQIEVLIARNKTQQMRDASSNRAKQQWRDQTLGRRGWHKKTQLEIQVEKYLPDTFVYEKRINNLFPDFTDENKKLIIEVQGKYWHKNREKEDKARFKIFENLGYCVLEISEDAIKDGSFVEKLHNFLQIHAENEIKN